MKPVFPPELIRSLKRLGHFDEEAFRAIHESGEPFISVRFNPAKRPVESDCGPAAVSGLSFSLGAPVPWCSEAFYLNERPSFTLDPLFHAGAYYVQEASGLFLEHALRNAADLSAPLKVLDLCAAPGGKSTLIQSLISNESLLLSNEVIKTRIPVLHQNMDKWGRMNGIISNNDPQDFKRLPGFFDILLIDAPCSGSGLFRKDPAAATGWSEDLVRLCQQRQQRILADSWDCLKENGVLIYSTCSYSPEENESIVEGILNDFDGEPVRIPLDPSWHIVETLSGKAGGYGYRFYPDKIKGEGFYLAVIRKRSAAGPFVKPREKRTRPAQREEICLREFVPDERLQFMRINEGVHVMPDKLLDDLLLMKNYLYLKKAGVLAGRMGAGEWIPDHELALSTGLSSRIPALELSRSDALKYLRREPFTSDAQPKGWAPVSFDGLKLGWVKVLSNRINNYYPKSWRILK